MPKKKRRYGTQKTTTKEGKREYQKDYMVEYRKREREAIRAARRLLGFDTRVRKTRKKPKPRGRRKK